MFQDESGLLSECLHTVHHYQNGILVRPKFEMVFLPNLVKEPEHSSPDEGRPRTPQRALYLLRETIRSTVMF